MAFCWGRNAALKGLALVVVRRPDNRSNSDDARLATASDDLVSERDTLVRDAVESQQSVPNMSTSSRTIHGLRIDLHAKRIELLGAKVSNVTQLPPADRDRVVGKVVRPHGVELFGGFAG